MSALTKINEMQPGRRYAYDEQQERKWHPDIAEDRFWRLAARYWDYTALGVPQMYNLYSVLEYVTRRNLPGAYIECGVFLGGSIMFAADMLMSLSSTRNIYACDTFTGFLSRTDKDVDMDGNAVCAPSVAPSWRQQAEANIRSVGYPAHRLHIVEGDVSVTLPGLGEPEFCVIRLDTDTYETTLLELQILYPRLVPRGVAIIDDFGWNLGARAAVEEYFATEAVLPMRVDRYCRAFMKL